MVSKRIIPNIFWHDVLHSNTERIQFFVDEEAGSLTPSFHQYLQKKLQFRNTFLKYKDSKTCIKTLK